MEPPDEPAGLFYRDMRHLSRWQIRLNGRRLEGPEVLKPGDEIELGTTVIQFEIE